MGHVHHGGVEPSLNLDDLRAHLNAQLGVEVRERLVHQEHLWAAHDCATHGDALTLATGERFRQTVEIVHQAEHLSGLLGACLDLGLLDLGNFQRETDVLANGHMRVQRVVLEHHCDVAVARWDVVNEAIADQQFSVGYFFEPSNHAQRGRLAAARGPDKYHEFTVLDVEVERVDSLWAIAVVLLADGAEGDFCHG